MIDLFLAMRDPVFIDLFKKLIPPVSLNLHGLDGVDEVHETVFVVLRDGDKLSNVDLLAVDKAVEILNLSNVGILIGLQHFDKELDE